MPNGDSEGQARRERLEIRYRQNQRGRANGIAALGDSPGMRPYTESDSEITANTSGLHARGIPREAWRWIGVGIALFITCLGVAVVVALL